MRRLLKCRKERDPSHSPTAPHSRLSAWNTSPKLTFIPCLSSLVSNAASSHTGLLKPFLYVMSAACSSCLDIPSLLSPGCCFLILLSGVFSGIICSGVLS